MKLCGPTPLGPPRPLVGKWWDILGGAKLSCKVGDGQLMHLDIENASANGLGFVKLE